MLARIDALFRAVDIDRSGEIDLSELRNYFGDVCEPLLRELDSIVVDGEVSEEEWRAFFELYLRPGICHLLYFSPFLFVFHLLSCHVSCSVSTLKGIARN